MLTLRAGSVPDSFAYVWDPFPPPGLLSQPLYKGRYLSLRGLQRKSSRRGGQETGRRGGRGKYGRDVRQINYSIDKITNESFKKHDPKKIKLAVSIK